MKHLPPWMYAGISDHHGKWRWTHRTCLQRAGAKGAEGATGATSAIVIDHAHKVMPHLTLGDEGTSHAYRKGNKIYVHRHVVPGSVLTVYDPRYDPKAAIIMLPVRYATPHAAIMQLARSTR